MGDLIKGQVLQHEVLVGHQRQGSYVREYGDNEKLSFIDQCH